MPAEARYAGGQECSVGQIGLLLRGWADQGLNPEPQPHLQIGPCLHHCASKAQALVALLVQPQPQAYECNAPLLLHCAAHAKLHQRWWQSQVFWCAAVRVCPVCRTLRAR